MILKAACDGACDQPPKSPRSPLAGRIVNSMVSERSARSRHSSVTHLLCVELRTELLDLPVEPFGLQHTIDRPVERMALRPQLLMRDEQVLLFAPALSDSPRPHLAQREIRRRS